VNRADLLAELRAATRKLTIPPAKVPTRREAARWPAALLRETLKRLTADGAIEGFGKIGRYRITSAGTKRAGIEQKANARVRRASQANRPEPRPVKRPQYETCLGCGNANRLPVQIKPVLRVRAVDALVWLTLQAGDTVRTKRGQWLNVDDDAIVASAIEVFARGLGWRPARRRRGKPGHS
jgi:hypothetical protein